MRPTRIARDNSDIEKIDFWLATHNPFPEGEHVISIGTGVIGTDDINCHRADEIGYDMMSNIVGKQFHSISFKRKDKIQPLATMNSSIRIEHARIPIDPLLLFQRMCITKHSEDDIRRYLAFDLAPFPLSLFSQDGMRKGTKSSLYSAFTPLQNVQFGVNHAQVIDGGFLLHKVVWGKATRFQTICLKYVTYVKNNFGSNVCIVFDGYTNDLAIAGTKASERLRRFRKNACPDYNFDETTIPTISQEKFLSNESNKEKFVNMLRIHLEVAAIEVRQAIEDADVQIVETAIEKLQMYDSVEIIGEDIDLLVLMTGRASKSSNIFFRKPAKGKSPQAIFGPTSFKHDDCVRDSIFFLHAFSGCDTTSCLYNVGKLKFLTTLKNRPQLQPAVELFKLKNIDPEILVTSGEVFLVALYGGDKNEKCLDSLRFKRFIKAASGTKLNLAVLPPTKTSAREHVLRTYQQVQTWMGNYKDPEEWGWNRTHAGLQPITTQASPAPPELLRLISCKCKGNCSGACGCRKAGIKCSVICLFCSGQTCLNSTTPAEILQNDELDDDMDDDSDDLLDTREANNGVFCEDDDYEHEPQAKRSRKI